MDKKVLLLTASLLALIMLVTPVMAVSPKKIPVILAWGSVTNTPAPEDQRRITGNAQHGIGETRTFTDYSITGGSIALTGGNSIWYGKYNFNLENGRGSKSWEIIIDFGAGSFEGKMLVHGTFEIRPSGWAMMFPDGVRHAVLQGTGAYKGWTLVWTHPRVDGTNLDPEAYMLIP